MLLNQANRFRKVGAFFCFGRAFKISGGRSRAGSNSALLSTLDGASGEFLTRIAG
jgi:hypothetical protein